VKLRSAKAQAFEEVDARSRAAVLGTWIAEALWDKGFGTDAVRFAFREMNLQRVALSVYDINPRAQRAYEKVGFVEEGRRRRAEFVDGRYGDVIEMGLLAEDLIES
jgi:RimJ/RimL family protein N-acetyltransferase